MPKPAPSRADFVRKPMDRMVHKVVRIMNVALGKRTDAEIVAAFDMTVKDAPMWAHTAKTMSTQIIRTESDKSATPTNTLNLVMVGQASSNAAWLDMVKGAVVQKMPAKKAPAAIEAKVVEAEPVKK